MSLLYKVPTEFPGDEPSPERLRSLIEEARATFLARVRPPVFTTINNSGEESDFESGPPRQPQPTPAPAAPAVKFEPSR